MNNLFIYFQDYTILFIMTKNTLNTYKNYLIAVSFLALGIASILLLISNHFNYAYGESYYFIKSKLNGLVLDIKGGDPRPGAFVQTWTANGNDNQLWTNTSDGFIKSKLNGLVLDIRGGDPFPGAFVQTWTANGNNNQLWTITKEGYIKSKLNGLVLDILGGNPLPGAHVQTWTQNNNLNQQWILEKSK
jgi:protocatechuate 3,4-dioxygenase beta subunit